MCIMSTVYNTVYTCICVCIGINALYASMHVVTVQYARMYIMFVCTILHVYIDVSFIIYEGLSKLLTYEG